VALYDITPKVTGTLAVWPGDTPPTPEVLLDMTRGDNITLSTLHATVHLGAHADAPSHYGRDAATIDEQPIDLYLGRCRVVRIAAARGSRISPSMLPRDLAGERILVATGTYPDGERWNDDFAAFEAETVDVLHERGARLVGIDTPSVDLSQAKDLVAHHRFLAHGMAILEGLALAGVPEGEYELIALPLRLVGFDASPVRAVLRTL
jgi:arylformamidase